MKIPRITNTSDFYSLSIVREKDLLELESKFKILRDAMIRIRENSSDASWAKQLAIATLHDIK